MRDFNYSILVVPCYVMIDLSDLPHCLLIFTAHLLVFSSDVAVFYLLNLVLKLEEFILLKLLLVWKLLFVSQFSSS